MNNRLSALVITKNEAATIARCLKSLAFVDEIVVVDAESSDATPQIAQQHGAQVIINPWPGYGPQRNFGLSKLHGEWVLVVDADEEVSPALAQAITATIAQPKTDFYWMRVITVFLGRPLSHLYGHNLRLFKRSAGRYSDDQVHEQIIDFSDAKVGLGNDHSTLITEPLLHHSHTTVASYLTKMHRYTSLDAQDMLRTRRHRSGRSIYPSPLLPLHLALRQFLKLLLYRRGLLDGRAGIIWCALSAYYEWEMAKKFLSLVKESLIKTGNVS